MEREQAVSVAKKDCIFTNYYWNYNVSCNDYVFLNSFN